MFPKGNRWLPHKHVDKQYHQTKNSYYKVQLLKVLQTDLIYLKEALKKNYFPTTLVDKCIKIFLNKQFTQKVVEHRVPKEELFIVLSYVKSTLTKKALITKFHFEKLKSFLNHQHD